MVGDVQGGTGRAFGRVEALRFQGNLLHLERASDLEVAFDPVLYES